MPRILRIINRFNLGGPTYNAAYLTRFLPSEYETLLVGGLKDESEASSEFILKNLGVDYTVLPSMRRRIDPFSDRASYLELKKIIRKFRPDIVHTHAAKAGALGRWAAFSTGVKVTVHTFHGHVFHSYFGGFSTRMFKQVERSLAKRTSAIIAISEKQKTELCTEHRICDAAKTHVIPLGFDLDRFQQDWDQKRKIFREKHRLADELSIGIVGRLVPVKNHLLFLNALAYLKAKSDRPFRAFIIGDGECRAELESRTDVLDLRDRVVFTSWEQQVDQIYPGLDVVCLTSFNEGTPVSLIEAQAAGVPIVSTDVGGIENVVVRDKTALLSPVSDPNRYYENLLKIVGNDTLRKNLAKMGWEHVKNRFHYSRLCADVDALYSRLLS